jgi:hypothetical protein
MAHYDTKFVQKRHFDGVQPRANPMLLKGVAANVMKGFGDVKCQRVPPVPDRFNQITIEKSGTNSS